MSFVKDLLTSRPVSQTVFTLADLNMFTGYSGAKLRSALKYATSEHELIRLAEGIYVLGVDYSREEFSNKYRSPSYVSFYSVLQAQGVVFQPYTSVFVASRRSENVTIDGQKYIYRKVKDQILLNTLGVTVEKGVVTATIERALCDKLYLDGLEHFDNLRQVDWELMERLKIEVFENSKMIGEFIRRYQI